VATWITHPSMNVPGGSRQLNVTTVNDCRAKCVVQSATCKGVDFDGSNACWVVTTTNRQPDPTNRVTHYEMLPEVKSCTTKCQGNSSLSWTETRHYHINEGTSMKDIITFKDCLTGCRDNDACVAFDWDTLSSTEKCWHITNDNPLQDAPYVYNYKKDCSLDGVRIITPGYFPPNGPGTTKMPEIKYVAGPSTRHPGWSTPSLAEYMSGDSLTIRPAYVVLIGLGLGCILMTVVGVIVICSYPLGGGGGGRTSIVKTTKVKKTKERKREMQSRVPKIYNEDHDDVGMNTISSNHNSTYNSGKKLYGETTYNNSKRDSYNEIKPKSTYNHSTRSNEDTLERNSMASAPPHEIAAYGGSNHRESAAYGGSTYGGSTQRDSAVAYGSAHHDSNADRTSDTQRYSGDHNSHTDRNSNVGYDQDNLIETRHSGYEHAEDTENEGYNKTDEDYD